MLTSEQFIRKKRDGCVLAAEEIEYFISGITSHRVSDAQIAAFTMATWFNGMNLQEKMALTCAMRDSGSVLEWPDLDGPVLDKHSTGGVGDLVSLILGPVVAACGGYVPMISGRGLGHTGGTLDKLESIPGFQSTPELKEIQRLVRSVGVAIVGQTSELAPADRRIYAVRDVTASVDSRPLIISSILSKKLSEGLDGLIMDIKCGSGAFMQNPDEAQALAEEITAVAGAAGLRCEAVITDMDQPLAFSAGNSLEVLEAMQFLAGEQRNPRLEEVVIRLCADLLCLGGLVENVDDAEQQVVRVLDNGLAAETFGKMVSAQGGPVDLMDRPEHYFQKAAVIKPVLATQKGNVHRLDALQVGTIVVHLGGGRLRGDDVIDPTVGLSDLCRVGDEVEPGQPLAMIHAGNENDWQRAHDEFMSALRVREDVASATPAVLGGVLAATEGA